jgi:hypothetical protein
MMANIVKKITVSENIFCSDELFIEIEMTDMKLIPNRIPTIEGKLKSDQLIPYAKFSNKSPLFRSFDGI